MIARVFCATIYVKPELLFLDHSAAGYSNEHHFSNDATREMIPCHSREGLRLCKAGLHLLAYAETLENETLRLEPFLGFCSHRACSLVSDSDRFGSKQLYLSTTPPNQTSSYFSWVLVVCDPRGVVFA